MADLDPRLRETVRSRAALRCEYCGISELLTLYEHEIDHVIALKHGGRTTENNLALCCALCNRFKGSDIASIDPETGQLTPLFHPRLDRWGEHFERNGAEILTRTATGRVTVRLLRMNSAARKAERRMPSR